MASGGEMFNDEDFTCMDGDESEDSEENVFFSVPTHNRFEQRNDGVFKQVTKKRK